MSILVWLVLGSFTINTKTIFPQVIKLNSYFECANNVHHRYENFNIFYNIDDIRKTIGKLAIVNVHVFKSLLTFFT